MFLLRRLLHLEKEVLRLKSEQRKDAARIVSLQDNNVDLARRYGMLLRECDQVRV